jgi:hypothetical protein
MKSDTYPIENDRIYRSDYLIWEQEIHQHQKLEQQVHGNHLQQQQMDQQQKHLQATLIEKKKKK